MPKPQKTKPKANPKVPSKKNKQKIQSKPVSITTKKSYWISLTAITVVALLGYGFASGVAMQKVGLILAVLLSVIGLACYVRFTPSDLEAKMRATFIFVGATVIGFIIWVGIVISLAAMGFNLQLENIFGFELFLLASQAIFIVIGGFIGELIGQNRKALSAFFGKLRK